MCSLQGTGAEWTLIDFVRGFLGGPGTNDCTCASLSPPFKRRKRFGCLEFEGGKSGYKIII